MNQSDKLIKHLNIFTKKEIPIGFIEAKNISGKNPKKVKIKLWLLISISC